MTRRAAAIVRSTIDLAHSLGMTMVAEGVEDEYTATQLALASCDTVQGFHFSKAVASAGARALDGRTRPGRPAARWRIVGGSAVTMTPIAGSSVTDVRALATEVLHGQQSLIVASGELEDLAQRCGAPTTAQVPWLLATTSAVHDRRSWAVLARDVAGQLVGAVVLVNRTEGLYETVTLAGTDDGQRGAILTHCVTAAEALGLAVSHALRRRRHRPDVELGPLPADSPVVEAFMLGLHGSTRTDSDGVPVIRRADAAEVDAYLSHGMSRTIRKATNRLTRDCMTATVRFTGDPAEIIDVLPQLEQCHRNRDHAQGRPSDLDDDQQLWLWQFRIHALAKAGKLELSTLHVDEVFAAYALGVVDGPVYRLLEGRFETRWARYSPGRLLEAAVVQRMLDDAALTTLDWMTAVAPEALLGTNDADPMVVLRISGDRAP